MGHHLMPRRGVIYTIVIENIAEKKITDFVSFYNLPSQILKQVNHNHTIMNVSYWLFIVFLMILFRLLTCIITGQLRTRWMNWWNMRFSMQKIWCKMARDLMYSTAWISWITHNSCKNSNLALVMEFSITTCTITILSMKKEHLM